MKQEVRVPEVSDGVTHGKVVSLSVAVGDRVEEDQTLLELETEKAVVALPSPFTGKITEVLVGEGDEVEIGQVVMAGEPEGAGGESGGDDEGGQSQQDEQEDETRADAPESATEAEGDQAAGEDAGEQPAPPEKDEPRREEREKREKPEQRPAADERSGAGRDGGQRDDLPPPRTEPTPPGEVAPASPIVRRFARELGVDIGAVQGSGPGGRISEDDVRKFVKRAMEGRSAASGAGGGGVAQRPLPDFSKWGPVRREPLSQVRKITAEAMAYAWATAPRVTQDDKADITALEDFRQRYNKRASQDGKLTMTAILVKLVARALELFPQLNSSLDLENQELILKEYVHVGVAVDTSRGLLVPVIRDADRKGLGNLATELNQTAAKTREGRISPADMEGGTFTISNLGGIGGTAFTPIVYAPQVAILGVSRAAMEPVWDGNEFQPRLMMPLSLSYDHRVVDGADGARFLRWLCEALEQPLLMAMEDAR
jgi:pyruvate dehydrogenase E2 component (dihydrolipoamide acetyltransferase)